MTTLLLVIYILAGHSYVDRYTVESMDMCIQALPLVAEKVVDTALLLCVNVASQSSI